MTGSWSGAAQTGSRDYTPDDVARVLEALPRGREEAMSQRTLCDMLHMDARTVRAILADRDGIDFVMAHSGDLMWDAERFEDTIGHTATLRARAQSELARVARRERYASVNLQRRQAGMAL